MLYVLSNFELSEYDQPFHLYNERQIHTNSSSVKNICSTFQCGNISSLLGKGLQGRILKINNQ